MTSDQWKMVKWAAIAVAVALMMYLGVIGATIGTFIVMAVILVGAVGVWKLADKQESEAKARELSGH